MISKRYLRRIILCAAALFLLGSLGWFYSFEQKCQTVRDSVVRLHIRAASDTDADQSLKLSVRDRLLAESESWFSSADSKEQAQQVLAAHLDDIKAICQDELGRQGSSQEVSITLGVSSFPTRTYDDLTLPAGYYDSLVIELDSGAGQNWWCVLFPSVCIPAASEVTADNFGQNGGLVYEDGVTYQVGFRVVEWYYRLRDWLRS